MPPPNDTTSPIQTAADFLGWACYLAVMGGGIADLRYLSPRPAGRAEEPEAGEILEALVTRSEAAPAASNGNGRTPSSYMVDAVVAPERQYPGREGERAGVGSF